jgi:glycosyltransferase involved in cell wall biosynthesis
MLKKNHNICFIIPAFNEEKRISKIILNLRKLGEVIVIDDFSSDKTNLIAKKSGAKVIKQKKNYGYDHALYTGFKKANDLSFKYIITFDADGQHSIKDAKKIIKLLNKSYILVYGNRKFRQRFMEKIFSLYANFFFDISDPLCGLKGYNLKMCRKHGLLKKKNYIGTKVLLECKIKKLNILEINISTTRRKDKSRFGRLLKGNLKILKVFIIIVFKDFMNLFLPKKNI